MTTLKLLALALAFIASGGILFADYFRTNRLVRGLAACAAIVAFFYLVLEIRSSISPSPSGEQATTPVPSAQASPEQRVPEIIVVPLAAQAKLRRVSVSGDGQIIHVIGAGGPVYAWNVKSNAVTKTKLSTSSKLSASLALSPDRQWLLEHDYSAGANLINLRTGAVTKVVFPPLSAEETTSKLAVSNNGSLLAVASYTVKYGPKDDKGKQEAEYSAQLRIMNVATKKQVCHDDIFHRGTFIGDLSFSHDGRSILSGSWDGGTRLLPVDCSKVTTLRGYRYTDAVALDGPGQRAASGAYKGVRLYSPITSYSEGVSAGSFLTSPTRLEFDPRGLFLAAGSPGGWVYMVDAGTGREVISKGGHSSEVVDLSFAPDGKTLASLGKEGTVVLWDTGSLEKMGTLHLFSDGEWVILRNEGQFCSSPEGDKWLRVRTVRPGRFWNSTIDQPIDSEIRKARTANCQV